PSRDLGWAPSGQLDDERVRLLEGRLSSQAVDGPARGHLLPASAVPAAAQRTVRLDDDVADLPGESVRAAEQLPALHDPTADPSPDRDQQHAARTAPGP